MFYILAVIGGLWLFCFVLRVLFGSSTEEVVVFIAPRQDRDDEKDKRNLGGGLGL